MVAVDYLDNLAAAQADPALAAALGRAQQHAPFDRLEWWRALAEDCLPDAEPALAVARDGASLCALPLMRGDRGQLCSLANWYNFWARPVFSAGADRDTLLAALAQALPAQARRLSLAPLAPTDAEPLASAFEQAGWRVFAQRCGSNHRLELACRSFAAYWAGRPGRLRETVRRKRARGAVSVHIARRFSDEDWVAYETVYRSSWKPAEGSPEFLRRFAEAEGAAGTLRLGLATLDGRPVAAQLWTVEAGTAYIHKLAHDEAARAHSPGTLLTAALFEQAIDRDGVATIDFGAGDDPYKRDWMEQERPLLRLDIHRPRDPRSWPHLARAAWRGIPRLVASPPGG